MLKKRETNFELLRFISMIMIILNHFVLYGGNVIGVVWYKESSIIYYLFYGFGKLGALLFVMITGYFMINSRVNYKKLFLLEGQVWFYSVIILFVMLLIGESVSFSDIFKSFFPNIMRTYWFYSGYFILYLLIPYINKLVSIISKKNYFKLLVIGFVFLILVPSIVIYNEKYDWYVYLIYYYLVGGYIKLYFKDDCRNFGYLMIFVVSYLGIVWFSYFIGNLSLSNRVLGSYILSFGGIDSIFIFICVVSLFLFFKNIEIRKFKFINVLGSVSFGVYILHNNPLMRNVLWGKLFNSSSLYGNPVMFFCCGIVISICIYFVFGFIDFVRKKIVEDRVFVVIWDRLCKVDFCRKIGIK